jgi:hypothetical protein
LLDAGFVADNGIDIERHADKRVKGIEPREADAVQS